MEDTRLSGRHVIVTGAARGIGRGIAARVAQAGADVTILDMAVEDAETTAEQVRDAGGAANIQRTDVSDPDAVDDAVSAAADALGPVHGLVNNAGVQDTISILETSVEDWDKHLAVNAKGVFLCSKAVASHMIDEGVDGSIVNIASVGAERPFEGQGAYAASKAAVKTFTVVLAKELADHGITANVVNPGTVDTPMVEQWLEENAEQHGGTPEEFLEETTDLHPLGRIGDPIEIGHVATLLLSDEGDWITGEAINVDGGFTVG